MKRIVGLLGAALLLLTAGCEVESGYGGYGGGYGAVYGEYPYRYYGGTSVYPGYAYPDYRHFPYDRDHYWDRHHYWDRGRYWNGHERHRRDWD